MSSAKGPVKPSKGKWPDPTLRPGESWMFRSGLIASLVLLAGFGASVFFWYHGVETVAKYAHSEEVERSLAQHLDSLKNLHDVQQQLVIERLAPLAEQATQPPSSATVKDWLMGAGVDFMGSTAEISVEPLEDSDAADKDRRAMEWLGRDRLRVFNVIVQFPKGTIYEDFRKTEEILQRYQILGVKLDEEIRPAIFQTNSIILLVCFSLLGAIFLFYSGRFKRRITEVIDGFSLWSERDPSFRFGTQFSGELRLITAQFNAMADDVDENRQKNIMLEKIASWQIIARKLAHEIKNPLTPIQMMVSQLKRRYKGDDENFGKLLEDAVSIITEEVGGLRRMVDSFSNFARLPSPEPRPTDLVPLCRHAVDLQAVVFEQHDIKFLTPLASAIAEIDEDLIRQVLINILKNACEACSESPAAITLELAAIGGQYLVTVNDTGPGIPQDQQLRIFEAYFTTKHTGPTPGMGLGLAVCQKIVMDHGGKISVHSRPGNTTFSIKLPGPEVTGD